MVCSPSNSFSSHHHINQRCDHLHPLIKYSIHFATLLFSLCPCSYNRTLTLYSSAPPFSSSSISLFFYFKDFRTRFRVYCCCNLKANPVFKQLSNWLHCYCVPFLGVSVSIFSFNFSMNFTLPFNLFSPPVCLRLFLVFLCCVSAVLTLSPYSDWFISQITSGHHCCRLFWTFLILLVPFSFSILPLQCLCFLWGTSNQLVSLCTYQN